MTHAETLERAIHKAIVAGWTVPYGSKEIQFTKGANSGDLGIAFCYPKDHAGFAIIEGWDVERLIFNHDFAKALWGEEPCDFDPMMIVMQTPPKRWIYHLQRMVIAEDPIAYLADNLPG